MIRGGVGCAEVASIGVPFVALFARVPRRDPVVWTANNATGGSLGQPRLWNHVGGALHGMNPRTSPLVV